jgi:hypothetical protein
MLNAADFETVYTEKSTNKEKRPPTTMIGSYPPVSKAGEHGLYNVNTYLLQPDRKFETLGPATVRSEQINSLLK